MPELSPLLLSIPRNPVLAVGLPIVLGYASGFPTKNATKGLWYNSLKEPPGRPPNQAFGIVWPILYACMGYASHLAVNAVDSNISLASSSGALYGLRLYYVQLGLNLAWTPLFFIWRKKGLALVEILALTGTVFHLTSVLDVATNGQSTWFLAPYCAWLAFASYLNAGYWWLNRSA